MKYTVEVTQTDIDKGDRACRYNCPVALALRRVIHTDVEVGDTCLATKIDDAIIDVESPPAVKEFVFDFDRGEEVKPFVFEVEF